MYASLGMLDLMFCMLQQVKNPYHVRIIAKDKNFNEEGIQLLDEIFREVGRLKIK
ncbi:hypothetical protein [Paenibacillus sp. JGP012]|uniref:hypothetical protein n=1 Tax=Paenibacillus sp. JGP012 TaxID=2735914 RepID=UPI0016132279|nr:hypothetical protein [Paenibacillus sp. JGP012]